MRLPIILIPGVLALGTPIHAGTGQPGELSLKQRIDGRTFPSIFQAWSPADNLPNEDKHQTLARHDLIWNGPGFFGLRWNNAHPGLADGFIAQSVEHGLAFRKMILKLNPNIVLIAEVRYRDANKSYLPDSHPWWLRGANGQPVAGWQEGGFPCLDFHNPEFRQQVAKQCKAVVASGVVDGVMLDWWSDDPSRLALIQEVRRAVGNKALILCNANDRTTPQTAPYINGYFMECYRSKTAQDWKRIADTLVWAEKNLRSPRVNCLETWFHKSRDDLDLMRATTTLALTLSNGYCLFSDPNPLPTPDHLHNWYRFWNKSLGKPMSEGTLATDGTVRREFVGGTAVYNPMGNRSVSVTFREVRTFADEERPIFVRSLAEVLRPGGLLHLLCFSDEEPGTEGPRRISQQEIRDAFHDRWTVRQIEPTQFDSIPRPDGPKFTPGGPKSWLATVERT
jgi:hypothetical protein